MFARMSRPSLRVTASLCGTAAALALVVPVADASAPASSNKKIVPGKSIGGVTLGMGYAEVQQRWGSGNTCAEAAATAVAQGGVAPNPTTYSGICNWAVPIPASVGINQGGAAATFENGTVTELEIYTRRSNSGAPVPTGPISKFKTERGKLPVGASVGKLLKAYPKAKPVIDDYVLTSGGRQTVFRTLNDRILSITISKA